MPSSPVHAQDRVLLPLWVRICRWLWKVSGFLGTAVLLSLGVNLLSTSLTSSRGLFPANSPFAALVTHCPRDTQRDTSKQAEKEKEVPLTSCEDKGKRKGKKEKEHRRSLVSGQKCTPSEKDM